MRALSVAIPDVITLCALHQVVFAEPSAVPLGMASVGGASVNVGIDRLRRDGRLGHAAISLRRGIRG